jgi:hypothetical protein
MDEKPNRSDEPEDVAGAQAPPPAEEPTAPEAPAQQDDGDDDTGGHRIYAKQVGVDLDAPA